MSDTVHRFLLVEPADMDRFEGWLEDMARRGLHYRHSGVFFVHFRQGEPASVRYRLEPMGSLWSRESQDYCRALGWDRLGQVGRDFELYRNPDPDAPELHTDPVVRACGLERVSKTLRLRCAAILLCLALYLVSAFLAMRPGDFWVERFVSGSALSLFPLALELLGIAAALRSFAAFFTIRRRLRRGVPSRRDGSWRWVAGSNLALLSLAGAFLLFSIWFFCASFTNDGWEGELDLVSEPYPILELRGLEGDPSLEAATSPTFLERFGYDAHNYVHCRRYPLLSEQYEVTQFLTDGGDYEPRLDMEWRRLSLPFLASPLLDELVYRYTEYNRFPDEYIVSELALPGFDRAVLAAGNRWPGQKLFLQAGNVVIYLDYSGTQDLTARPELLSALAQFDAR